MTVSANDAHPFPIYNARYRAIFPLLDADGDPVSPSSPDTELSQDTGTFADATNEVAEIATSSGVVYLDLINTETDCTSLVIKAASTGAKSTIMTLYPLRMPVLRTGTAQAGAATTITLDSGASAVDDYYSGCYVNITNNSPANVQGQARLIIDYVGSTKVATVAAWGTNPSVASTFEILVPPGMQTIMWAGAPVADPSVAGVPEVDLTHAAGTAITATGGRPEVNTSHAAGTAWNSGAIGAATLASDTIAAGKIATGAITAAKFAAGAIDASAIADNAIDAGALAADAVTEIRSLASGTSDSGTTTTMVDAARTEADTDYWKDQIIVFTSGNIVGQARLITGFDPATDTITFTPATTQAVATQTYEIWPSARVDVASWLGSAAAAVSSAGVPKVDVGRWNGDAVAAPAIAGVPKVDINAVAGAYDAIDGSYLTGKVTVQGIASTSFVAGAIDSSAIAPNAIGASELAADAVAEIADAVWDEDATAHQTQGTFGQAIGDPAADTNTIYKAVVTDATGATVGVDVVAVKAETAAILDDTDDIGVAGAGLTALASQASVTTIDDFLDTEIAAIIATLVGIVPVSGTIGATGNDATHLHLAGIAWADDGPNSMLLTVKDVSAGIFVSRWIEDFATATDLATVATLPFTPEASVDQYWVLSPRADVTGGSGLDAAGVRAAIGLAAANLDTQLDGLPTAAENADAVWDEATAGHVAAGSFGKAAADILEDTGTTLQGEVDGIQADTEDIQSRLPAVLVGGRMDASVGAMAAGVVTAAAIATGAIDADALASDAVDEIWAKALQDLAAAPGSTPSALQALNWLFELARNKVTQSSTTMTLMKADGTTPLATSAVSDAAGTYTRDAFV